MHSCDTAWLKTGRSPSEASFGSAAANEARRIESNCRSRCRNRGLKADKKLMEDKENVAAARHSIKTYILPSLGQGLADGGGPKCRNNLFEVLDRLARMTAGLSTGQKNDWTWFKSSWDQEVLTFYGEHWPAILSGWVQSVLDDERSNAFSMFAHSGTLRVFHGIAALPVPGC